MANPKHFAIFHRGDKAWNKWRHRKPNITPDLSEAKLRLAKLYRADLSGADLRGANLSNANLSNANLGRADLRMADLWKAKLPGADLSSADLHKANLFGADLHGGNLSRANLHEANFREADLSHTDLRGAYLRKAKLSKTDLRDAYLSNANLCEADLSGADMTGVILASADGTGANLGGAKLTSAQLTMRDTGEVMGSFLDLATADGLETADFGDPAFLPRYLAEAFDYAHKPDLEEKKQLPRLFHKAVANIKALRRLYGIQEVLPADVVEIVRTITAELIEYLRHHPKAMYTIKPRQFEELIAEVLSSYGWQVVLTPASKDGGYDLYAIVKDAPGAPTSWIIECKKYAPERKVGVEIVRGLWGIKLDLRVANAMLATTSYFTQGAQAFKSSRYDLALRDYQGILEWINEYRPHPDGKLYIRDHHIVLPGEKPPKAGP